MRNSTQRNTCHTNDAQRITQVRTAFGAGIITNCLDLAVNAGGTLANTNVVVKWTLPTILSNVYGTATSTWLGGAASTEQVEELTEVLARLTHVPAQSATHPGVANVPAMTNGVPYLHTSGTISFARPATWPTNWTMQTCLQFEQNGGFGNSVIDDFIKFNGVDIPPQPAPCPALATAFTHGLTNFNLAAANTLELWDGGTCGGTNNAAYLADSHLVHVLSVPVVSISFTNTDLCAGFDDWTGWNVDRDLRVWVPVGQNTNNTIQVNISPASVLPLISFTTENAGIATVSPASTTSSSTTLTITGTATGGTIQDTLITVTIAGAVTNAAFHVDVLPKKTNTTVALFYVTDDNVANTTPANTPTSNALETKLNDIFGKQANVFFTVWPGVSKTVNYTNDEFLDIRDWLSCLAGPEVVEIRTRIRTNATIHVYHVRQIYDRCNLTGTGAIGYGLPARDAFTQDAHAGSAAYVDAHEIGHVLGITSHLPPNNAANATFLMWPAAVAPEPCRLRRDDWRTANTSAP